MTNSLGPSEPQDFFANMPPRPPYLLNRPTSPGIEATNKQLAAESAALAVSCVEIAQAFWGEPTSKTRHDLRWGTHGSRSVNIERNAWYDHEAKEGGYTIELVERELRCTRDTAISWLLDASNYSGAVSLSKLSGIEPTPLGHIVATYDYVDESGTVLFQVCRYEPKTFRQRRPDGKGGWTWSVKGLRQVPYHLPELLKAVSEGRTIAIVEGEKDVDNLRRHGIAATCNAGGAGKWQREFIPYLRGADVVLIPDNDDSGRKHMDQVGDSLRFQAASVRVLELPGLGDKGDVSDWLAAGHTPGELSRLMAQAPHWQRRAPFLPREARRPEEQAGTGMAPEAEPPRALMRELPPAHPFPIDALGKLLAPAARAIHDRIRAPLAICGQSVLAAATLAVQGHANVELPTGHAKPLSSFFVSIAATGERKSAVDREALWPVRKREAVLREVAAGDRFEYENQEIAWKKAREAAIKKAKGNHAQIEAALAGIGPPPIPPLEPLLVCGEPTFEGLCKLLAVGSPSIGIFAAEGGQFIGGHGMADDAKLRTAAGLSALWDGEPIKRVRALDGTTILPGRRVAMHLMAQPDVAVIWLGDRLLIEQGLLSRVLLTAPQSASGSRTWKEVSPDVDAVMKRYGARLLEILERPLPLAKGTHNELEPRSLALSPEARRAWIAFHDDVEPRLAAGGEFEPVRGLANKLPEHAARIAAVLTLVEDVESGEVGLAKMEDGIALARHYAAEAIRLFGASRVSGDLREAQQLLTWLQTNWQEPRVSLPDIYQRGPSSIRDKARAHRAVTILADHGWLVPAPAGNVDGTFRREVWRILQA